MTDNKTAEQTSFSKRFVALLQWENWLHSGVAFSSGFLFLYLLQYGQYTFVTLVSYLILLQLLVCLLYMGGMKLWIRYVQGTPISSVVTQSSSSTASASDKVRYVSSEALVAWSTQAADTINAVVEYTINVFRVRSLSLTLKIMLVVFLVGWFGRYLHSITIYLIIHILMFTLPPIYKSQQAFIDQQTQTWSTKAQTIFSHLPASLQSILKLKSD
eukprot:TRINITY_DN5616_c0_g1_i1.p1 TRINITY_DN5616_c0_g1~~TRINITY_DN5616_c0_g1_i1.p1  ORF type:complete len:215 (+),score=30.89 TRINITY_DN5616_c0_g1_i1:50-694(+)